MFCDNYKEKNNLVSRSQHIVTIITLFNNRRVEIICKAFISSLNTHVFADKVLHTGFVGVCLCVSVKVWVCVCSSSINN